MTKKTISTMIGLFFLVCFTTSAFYYLKTPTITTPVVYYLKPGTSKKALTAQLAEQHLITHPHFFTLYVSVQALISKDIPLKTGEYIFPAHSTPLSIFKQVTEGKGLYYRSFTIVPGWTFAQLRQELLRNENFHHQLKYWTDTEVMAHLGYPNLPPEGEFFPDTYFYTRGISDFIIVQQAFHLMQKQLNQAWTSRDPIVPFKNAYEMLIAASLVEKEAYLNLEKPIIAGVLINRLQKNMLLQFDPTVIYGLGSHYTGKIYRADLLAENPYNTYRHKGLPPTPIALPSITSLSAVSRPQQHHYLYFVAKGDGSHQFTEDLQSHHKAVTAANKASAYFFNDDKIRQYLRGLFP